MALYRKKPVVVEAFKYMPGMEDGFQQRYDSQMCAECRNIYSGCKYNRPYINTSEGRICISQGDYIVVHSNGDQYVIKSDIFEKDYEPI